MEISESLWKAIETNTDLLNEQLKEQDETMFRQAKQIAEQRIIIEELKIQNLNHEKEIYKLEQRIREAKSSAGFNRRCSARVINDLNQKIDEYEKKERNPIGNFFSKNRRKTPGFSQ